MTTEMKKTKPSQAMSTLMFWNKQNEKSNQNGAENGTTNGKNNKKTWLHSPESLTNGHVAYLVKFLGSTPVDQAKGIDTVKDAIRRLQFAQQMKKAETGANGKIKKVELTISVDGVAVQEPRGTKILHQFPLHNISYCADEKGVKKFFSFIAKTSTSTNVPNGSVGDASSTASSSDDTHECFVFISSKLASDITLTIGQAFELAYRRYMSESAKPEVSKLQSQNKLLENQLAAYRQRLKDLSEILPKSELERILQRYALRDILELPQQENGDLTNANGSNTPDLGIDVSSPNNDDHLMLIETSDNNHSFAPIVPPRNLQSQISSTLDALKPSVGTKLEGLLLNSDSDSDFDPRADENDTIPSEKHSDSFFGFEPPKATIGQQLFAANAMNGNGINTNGVSTNGTINSSSPPLLAPPPKAAIPRRNGSANAGNQDLFGSTPFDAPIQSSPFDVSGNFFAPTSSKSTGSLTSSASSTSSQSSASNQFNELNVSDVGSDNGLLTDLKAFTVNVDKLNGAMTRTQDKDPFAVQPTTVGNPFLMNSPFGGESTPPKQQSIKTTINYDAFRDTFTAHDIHEPIISDTQAMTPPKPSISVDLFKDAAAAAFNEFGAGTFRKHEFYNKMPELIAQNGKNAFN